MVLLISGNYSLFIYNIGYRILITGIEAHYAAKFGDQAGKRIAKTLTHLHLHITWRKDSRSFN